MKSSHKLKNEKSYYIQAIKQRLISIDLNFFYKSNEIKISKTYPPVLVVFAPIVQALAPKPFEKHWDWSRMKSENH